MGLCDAEPRLTLLPPLTPRPTPGTRMDTTDTIPPTTGEVTTAGDILTDMATGAERRGRPSQRLSLLPPPMPTLRPTPGTHMDTTIPPTTGDTTEAGAILTGMAMATGAERRGRPRLSLLPPLMLTLRLTPTTATTATIPTTGDTTATATGTADTGGKSLGYSYRVHRSSRGTLINKKCTI